jgi:hypothetical protein
MKERRFQLLQVSLFTIFFVLTAYYIVLPFFSPSALHLDIKLPLWVFYTIQTNVFACIWYGFILVNLILKKEKRLNQVLALSITIYILITGIIYWSVLVPMLGAAPALFLFRNIWTHAITPLFTLFCFFQYANKGKISKSQFPFILSYPLFYLIFSYGLIYPIYGKYPYPFLNPDIMGGWVFVIIACIGIIAIFLATAYGFSHLHNKSLKD